MKHVAQILVISSLLVSMAACKPVQSVYPFFDPKDVVFDSRLVGKWISHEDNEDAEDNSEWTLCFAKEKVDSSIYTVRFAVRDNKPGENGAEESEWTFAGNLFRVGDVRYLDLLPQKWSAKPHGPVLDQADGFIAPTHTVYRVKLDGDYLTLSYLDDEKVNSFLNENKLSLAVESSDYFLLTGTTEELQTQLLAQAEKEGLLEDRIEFVRQK